MNENDLVYEIARRVKQWADMPMRVLRKVEEPDVSCRTRGEIIEYAICEEFIKENPRDLEAV